MIEEGKMTAAKNKYDGPRLELALKYNHIPDQLKDKVDKVDIFDVKFALANIWDFKNLDHPHIYYAERPTCPVHHKRLKE